MPAASSHPPKMAVSGGPFLLGSLEIGRFLAASLVLLSHLFPDLSQYAATAGGAGLYRLHLPAALAVQYFFVLSGFVMMTAHGGDFGRPAASLVFWWRRACRIFPLYWLVLLLALKDHTAGLTGTCAWQLLTLAPLSVGDFVTLYLVPAWSLRYEIAFYLVFGLCLLPRIGRALLALWVAADIFYQYETYAGFKPLAWPGLHGGASTALQFVNHGAVIKFYRLAYFDLNYFFSIYNAYFFAGLLGGWLFRQKLLSRRVSAAMMASGALLLAIAMPALQWGLDYTSRTSGWATPAAALGIAALITGLASLERCGTLRFHPWAYRLGAMSYPVYILHEPLLQIVQDFIGTPWRLGSMALFGLLAASLTLVYTASAALAFYVDQPIQKWLRKKPPLKLGLKGR